HVARPILGHDGENYWFVQASNTSRSIRREHVIERGDVPGRRSNLLCLGLVKLFADFEVGQLPLTGSAVTLKLPIHRPVDAGAGNRHWLLDLDKLTVQPSLRFVIDLLEHLCDKSDLVRIIFRHDIAADGKTSTSRERLIGFTHVFLSKAESGQSFSLTVLK